MGLPNPNDSGSLKAPSPIDLQRISTAGTTGTTGSDTGTAKKEKRRSGFFSFGKKDKDKDKDKEREREKEVSASLPYRLAPYTSTSHTRRRSRRDQNGDYGGPR